jgi:hypothetical protein
VIVARDRTMVPNTFVVELGHRDHDRLSVYAEALGSELADMVREHATEQHYAFVGPVTVDFELADDLDTGIFRVRSAAKAGATAGAGLAPAGSPSGASTAPYLEVNGATFTLTGQAAVIGRGSDVDLRIDDPGISRRHAEVRVRGQVARVVDLGSTNGLVVNGQRVTQAELADGGQLTLGNTTVVFHAGAR